MHHKRSKTDATSRQNKLRRISANGGSLSSIASKRTQHGERQAGWVTSKILRSENTPLSHRDHM